MTIKQNLIIQASWISIAGNALLSISKITVGIIAGSLAVVGDGIDSATDIVASVITLVTARILRKPPNIKYPYGYRRADTIATKALSFVIFFAGAQLAISSISKITEISSNEIPDNIAIYVTLFSIFGKSGLALYQFKVGSKVNSPMLIANAKNMRNDVIISLTVLAGLFFTCILEFPVIDIVTGLLVSLWIMRSAYFIFMESNMELMDGIQDPAIYKDLFDAVNAIDGVNNPHRARIRKLGAMYVIAVDIEADGNLTLNKAHELAEEVEAGIKNKIDNVYDILVHVEPMGKEHKKEQFGISEEDVKGK
ncbi:MAG: cation diffusion facilitator family transporter [Bacteroidota bacterium]